MAANPLAGSVPVQKRLLRIAAWLAEHAVGQSQDLHLLTMAVGVLISLLTHKTELIVRGVYGAGKTQCIALLAAFFALRGHEVYYAARENTTIVAMATFVHQLLPRAPDDEWPDAIRLFSQPQARTSEGTPLDARDTDKNQHVWHAKLVLATTGLHLAQFRHKHRPLAKAVDYADIFIYDDAQQEAALSDLAILGALPRKCLVLRPSKPPVAQGPVISHAKSGTSLTNLRLGSVPRASHTSRKCFRCCCSPCCSMTFRLRWPLPCLSALTQRRLVLLVRRGPCPVVENTQPQCRSLQMPRALLHVVGEVPLRWHTAGDLDACAGERAPHNWHGMLPVSWRVQPGVYTMMALSRYRDALLQNCSPERPLVYQPLIPQILTACYHCILLPPRAFDAHPPVTRDVFYAVALFLQLRAHYPELVRQHRGAGSLLLTPRLDAQATFAKLFADIGREGDVRYAKLDDLLKGGLPPPSAVNSRHVQALRADLRAETLSHAAGLTSHSTILM